MRIALEVTAARITLPQLTESDFAELEGYMAQMTHLAGGGPPALALFRGPHRAFHERFVSRCRPRSTRLIAELFDHSERYRRVYGSINPISTTSVTPSTARCSTLRSPRRRRARGRAGRALRRDGAAGHLRARPRLPPRHGCARRVAAVAPGALYAFG